MHTNVAPGQAVPQVSRQREDELRSLLADMPAVPLRRHYLRGNVVDVLKCDATTGVVLARVPPDAAKAWPFGLLLRWLGHVWRVRPGHTSSITGMELFELEYWGTCFTDLRRYTTKASA